jgi:hypothetical protein
VREKLKIAEKGKRLATKQRKSLAEAPKFPTEVKLYDN